MVPGTNAPPLADAGRNGAHEQSPGHPYGMLIDPVLAPIPAFREVPWYGR